MKRIVSMVFIVTLVFAGCASTQSKNDRHGKDGKIQGSPIHDEARGADLNATDSSGLNNLMMDQQEIEMKEALATSEAAAIRRDEKLLAITLKGDVSFDPETASLKTGLNKELDKIAQILIKYPQTRIAIEGHTDNTGSDAYNQQLSEHRAKMVMTHLIERGVSAQRIKIAGYGARLPVATNATLQGREMNRRVEIRIQPNI